MGKFKKVVPRDESMQGGNQEVSKGGEAPAASQDNQNFSVKKSSKSVKMKNKNKKYKLNIGAGDNLNTTLENEVISPIIRDEVSEEKINSVKIKNKKKKKSKDKISKNLPVVLSSSTNEKPPIQDLNDTKLVKPTENSNNLGKTKKKNKKTGKDKGLPKTDNESTPLKATTQESTAKGNLKKQSLNLENIENTIFVGNLPQNVKIKQLKTLFSQFGVVKTVRVRTQNGKKLFKHKTRKDAESLNAYVVMENIEGAENSLKLNGIDFKGRHIRVNKAKGYDNDVDSKHVILVGNLKYSANDEKLYGIFSSCGDIEYVRTINSNKGCKGIAYVCFKKSESVGLALELNGTMLDDRPIRVERYSVNKLGAMEKRKIAEQQAISGPKRRIQEKNLKGSKKGPPNVGKNPTSIKSGKHPEYLSKNTKKKSEFRGVQMSSKKKFKKKKKGNKMLELAKKIAPKS